jgi:hypothetical protein
MFTTAKPDGNGRFTGSVSIQAGDRRFVIEASDFSLEEAGTRNLGDGDRQYEELWIAHADPDHEVAPADDESDGLPFEAVHVQVIRFNGDFYQFYDDPQVIGSEQYPIRVEDDLEFVDPDEQGPEVDE